MTILPYESSEHENWLKRAWESRQGIDFPVRLLSDTGLVVVNGIYPVAAAFLYKTNSKVAWLGWPITEPESTPEARSEALNMIFEKLHVMAKLEDYELIWTTSGIPALQERLEELGYKVGDEGINQYFKELE